MSAGSPSQFEPLTPRERLPSQDLRDAWPVLDAEERVQGFRLLEHEVAEEFFQTLSTQDHVDLFMQFSARERRLWVRTLAPDDAADLLQTIDEEHRPELTALLDGPTQREVSSLLAYAEDAAGGLMSPRFARVRPEMSVDEAIVYLRKQANDHVETLYYAYALDREQRLLGVVSFRDLFQARGSERIQDVMQTDVVVVPDDMDQEEVGRLFSDHDLLALPVLGPGGRMKGIVTIDDIVDVVEEEATEDIQKMGAVEALDKPYLENSLPEILRKRGPWMAILFVGEMLTISAMAGYEDRLEAASFLAVFVPLIISAGGNSGSQASTLVIRAVALGELELRDWLRVLLREIRTGIALGALLGLMGFVSIFLRGEAYPDSVTPVRVGLTVGCSVMAVVLWGSLSGSMLPLLLRRLGLDPASASAPMVATIVDVSGLILYFTIASFWLSGILG